MKTTKIITETREVHVCDFCANGDPTVGNPATCIVCGKEACGNCMYQQLREIEVKRPHYWPISGTLRPEAVVLWACTNCHDGLTQQVVAVNSKVAAADKYMQFFVTDYLWQGRNSIMKELERRKSKKESV